MVSLTPLWKSAQQAQDEIQSQQNQNVNSCFSFQNKRCVPTKQFYWYSVLIAPPAKVALPTCSSVSHCLRSSKFTLSFNCQFGFQFLNNLNNWALLLSPIKTITPSKPTSRSWSLLFTGRTVLKAHLQHRKQVYSHFEGVIKITRLVWIFFYGLVKHGSSIEVTKNTLFTWEATYIRKQTVSLVHTAFIPGVQEPFKYFKIQGSHWMIKPVNSEQNTVYSGSERCANHSHKTDINHRSTRCSNTGFASRLFHYPK